MEQQTHLMLKPALLLINIISAIGIGAENTPLIKHFHKHLEHFHCCSPWYVRSTLHNPNKHKSINPLINPINTVKDRRKQKQMLIESMFYSQL